MNHKDIFQHIASEVSELIEEGAHPNEVAQALAAVSIDLALNMAPTPEHAFLTVLGALRNMTSAHINRNEAESVDSEDANDNDETEESTVQVHTAGVASTLPDTSLATTSKRWNPSPNPV